jgi:hypothetical protein
MKLMHPLSIAGIFLWMAAVIAGQETVLPSGIYPITHIELAARPGLHQIRPNQFAGIGPALSFKSIGIYSVNNANTSFSLVVEYRGPVCSSALMQLDTQAILSYSGGGETSNQPGVARNCDVSFTLTPMQAERASKLFHTTRHTRHEIGGQLAGTFSIANSRYLVLRLSNPPDAPAIQWYQRGHRGPRDDQFSMRITRNGKPVQVILAADFGGPGSFRTLNPGGQFEIRAPIAGWGDISSPGHYVVEAAYETILQPTGDFPDHRTEVWDRRFEATVSFDVPGNSGTSP